MKLAITTLFMFVLCFTHAQQGLQMDFTEKDSSQMRLEREIQYRQLISGTLNSGLMDEKIELPDFNYMAELRTRYTVGVNMLPFNENSFNLFSSGMAPVFYSPIYTYGKVLSSAAYSLGEKFAVGGYSFGVNSMFSPPNLPGTNNFDNYGSTLFMQYKVSKKFKIETRISVTQDGRNGF